MRWRSRGAGRLRHSSFGHQLPWLLLQGGTWEIGKYHNFAAVLHYWIITPLLHPENLAFGNPLSSAILLPHGYLSDNIMSMIAMSLSTLG